MPSVRRGVQVPPRRRLDLAGAGVLAVVVAAGTGLPAQSDCVFIRGEINNLDGKQIVDTNDAVEILAYLYLGVSAPDCPQAADVNDNGLVEPSDFTYLIRHLRDAGPPPPPPFPEAGTDPTPEVTVPEERDARFRFEVESGAGVPSGTGVEIPVRFSSEEPVTGLQAVLSLGRDDDGDCPDLLVQEIRVEEGTLLSESSSEYILAEFDNSEGLAWIGALKDFATPFAPSGGEDATLPAGEDQLLATLVLAVAACADRGPAPIEFVDGVELPNDNVTPPVTLPEVHNLVALGDSVVRPELGEAGEIDVRSGFIRGDANKDDGVDIGDPVFLLDYTFKGGPEPPCLDAADANNDTDVDISDPVFVLNYLFTGGPQPSEPFPQAGVDPSDDGTESLGCASDG